MNILIIYKIKKNIHKTLETRLITIPYMYVFE